MKYYAGLGSRVVSATDTEVIRQVVKYLENKGYTLRTGSGVGVQEAFRKATKNKEVYTPWGKPRKGEIYQIPKRAYEIASGCTGKWISLKPTVKSILATNVCILLGKELNSQVKTCLMWETNDLSENIMFMRRVCSLYNIRIYNLANISQAQVLSAISGGDNE